MTPRFVESVHHRHQRATDCDRAFSNKQATEEGGPWSKRPLHMDPTLWPVRLSHRVTSERLALLYSY